MILPLEDVQVPRPPEWEACDQIAAEEDEEHGFLDLDGRLGRFRDNVYEVMSSGVVLQGCDA